TEVRDRDGHYVEEIARGAFSKTVHDRFAMRAKAGKPPLISVFYNHGQTLFGTPSEQGSTPLGTPLDIREDGRGLLTVTRYSRSQWAETILELIRDGAIGGMSFRGSFLKSSPSRGPWYPGPDGELTVVTRRQIALTEYGPTPIPAYDE